MIGLISLLAFSVAMTAAATEQIVPIQVKGARTVALQLLVEGAGPVHLVTGTGTNCATSQTRVLTLPKTTTGGPTVNETQIARIGGPAARGFSVTGVALPAGRAMCVTNTMRQPVRGNGEAKP